MTATIWVDTETETTIELGETNNALLVSRQGVYMDTPCRFSILTLGFSSRPQQDTLVEAILQCQQV